MVPWKKTKTRGRSSGATRSRPQQGYWDMQNDDNGLTAWDEEEEEEEDDDGGYEEHYYHDRDQRGKKNQDVTWEGWNRDTSNKNQGTTEVWGGAEDWAAGGTSSWGDNNTNKQSKRQDPWSTRTERETWGDTTTENHDTGWGAQGGTQVQEGWGNVESWGANAGDQGKQKASEWPDDSAWAKENTTATKKRKGKKEEKKSAASEWPTSTNKEFDMQQLLQSMYQRDLAQRMEKVAAPPRISDTQWSSDAVDTVRTIPGPPGGGGSTFRYVDSGGYALKLAEKAFFNRYDRFARDRFHWTFSPYKDERVAIAMNRVHSERYPIARLGIMKFLEFGERGALMLNVEYRSKRAPREMVLDWFTWSQANETLDRTLQQSLAYYDPEEHVLVFIFLPSKSGNSPSGGKKLAIPVTLKGSYRDAIKKKKAEIARYASDMVIHIDDIDPETGAPRFRKPPPKEEPEPKKKWFRFA